MAFASWPSTGLLGGVALSGSWQLTPRPEIRKTDYDAGPVEMRTRIARVIYEGTFTVVMSGEEFAALRTFFYHTVHAGVDKFMMPVWDGETYPICTVQFTEPYSATYHSPDFMTVELHLLVYDLVVLDDAALWMVENYGGDFTVTFANALHPVVHVDYPDCFPLPPSP